ncbi:MAG: aminomethyltransferase family protein [Acidobacteriota bacterium]
MLSTDTYQAARQRAASIDRSDRGRIVVSGADRASYLQGLLTNDVVALKPGEGCYAAYLTPQGRMIADLFVYELGDVMLLTVPLAQKDGVMARLDQFIFSEDVQLGDVTDTFFTLAIVGPEAAPIVGRLVGDPGGEISMLPEHGNRRVAFAGGAAIVTRITDTGEPGFDVYVEQRCVDVLRAALAAEGVPAAGPEVAAAIRIEAGMPKFNLDMDTDTIPLEAGIEPRAISLSKGCYVGQEVIIRVLHRGHGRVARKLAGLLLEGAVVPAAGADITVESRVIGHVTSSAASPSLGRPIALAYLHRDFLAPGTAVSVAGQPAAVAALPFVSIGEARPIPNQS